MFELLPGANGIAMRFETAPEKAMELTPVAPDTYMLRMRFLRDASGKGTGFEYNPVVKGIRFTRLGDRRSADGAKAPAASVQGLRLEGPARA